MWRAFPKFALIKVVFTAFAILIVATLSMLTSYSVIDGNFTQSLKFSSYLIIPFILVSYLIGTKLWKPIWHLPFFGKLLNENVCPDLNGVWKGKVTSNFNCEDGQWTEKDVRAEIKADLFKISMNLISEDRYQDSKVLSSDIYKDPRTSSFYFSYIFEGNVPKPKAGDSKIFHGAGNLEVKFHKDNMTLEGGYWTDRGWHEKKNTAGQIRLEKQVQK